MPAGLWWRCTYWCLLVVLKGCVHRRPVQAARCPRENADPVESTDMGTAVDDNGYLCGMAEKFTSWGLGTWRERRGKVWLERGSAESWKAAGINHGRRKGPMASWSAPPQRATSSPGIFALCQLPSNIKQSIQLEQAVLLPVPCGTPV